MRVPLKLNEIEQEHLQELYDAAGVARDELPYTEAFDKLCQDFQDRTFKNAHHEQVFGAILKYVRSSTCGAKLKTPVQLSGEQIAQLKAIINRHGTAGRLAPYSAEYEAALKEYNAATSQELSPRDFWLLVARCQARSRPSSGKRAAVKVRSEFSESDEAGD